MDMSGAFNVVVLTFHLFICLGTVCATEMANRFCPTSGESGSILMVKRSGYPSGSGFVAEGILSFIKGCDELTFAAANTTTNAVHQRQCMHLTAMLVLQSWAAGWSEA